MARTHNIKKDFYGEKGSSLTIYNGAFCAWFVALQSISHKAAVPSLSLSHRWSLIRPHPARRGKGSAVASLSLTVGH